MSSPYLPSIYAFDNPLPVNHYYEFARLAGCVPKLSHEHRNKEVFECLVAADSSVLQNASQLIATTRGYFGSFAWVPVVDGNFIEDSPVCQLSRGAIAGKHVLVGVSNSIPKKTTGQSFHCREEWHLESRKHTDTQMLSLTDKRERGSAPHKSKSSIQETV